MEKFKRQVIAQRPEIEPYDWPLYVFGKWPRIIYKKISNYLYHDSFMGSWSVSALQDLVLTLSVAYLVLVFFYSFFINPIVIGVIWRHIEEKFAGSFSWYMRDSVPIRDFKLFHLCYCLLIAYLVVLLLAQLPEALHYFKMYEWLTYYCAVDHKSTFMHQRQFKGNRMELMNIQPSKVKAPTRAVYVLHKPW